MNTRTQHNQDIGYDLEITKTNRRATCGGTWVHGRIAAHRFQALVFPEHAEEPNFELDESRISKLWIRREADRKTVCNFDRGWDIQPADATAKEIVDFLAEGLAQYTYGR
ncbi:MAG: hypothetical protein JXM70_29695 [Pirellulales bacterium]|nr:hypothetical protein [Pirellulales bacterium]